MGMMSVQAGAFVGQRADLVTFLAKWLYSHILGSDIMIGKLPPLEEWMIKENYFAVICEFKH